MASLQGHTLGQRHKHYNALVQQAIAKKDPNIKNINYEENDVDNMIKVDIACAERNVQYILEVFKCDDMLYISRAISKSTWLITDRQYVHIINPKYLHSHLFPQMNARAITKLMLHIRLHLKDEPRVEEFYEFVFERNRAGSLHWLANCSESFIEKQVAARAEHIPLKLLKRFCRQSINILSTLVTNCTNNKHTNIFNETKHFLKHKDTAGVYLNLVCTTKRNKHFDFCLNAKYTSLALNNCLDTVMENFEFLRAFIDVTIFAKYIKTDEIKSFILKTQKTWSYETLAPFLVRLPRDDILDFLSELYKVEYKHGEERDKNALEALFYAIEQNTLMNTNKIYRWYRFVPFDIAFRDMKKFISTESDSEERHSMLVVLLTCADYDFRHVETVLQFYLKKHINEPYIRKKMFIDSVLAQHRAFRFDDSAWNILNTLFRSCEVYIESDNDVQEALVHIILRDVLLDRPVHEVVEDKFEIDSFLRFKNELTPHEQDKVFNYLYNLLAKKICSQRKDSETGIRKTVDLLKNMWSILKDWGRLESHNEFVIKNIAELCEIEETATWAEEYKCKKSKKGVKGNKPTYTNISSIYKMVKSYRKNLFENSFVLNNSEEVLLNALKHEPGLLARAASPVDALRHNNNVSLGRFLNKLRVYWPDTLAREWAQENRENLHKIGSHSALVRGILTLMPHKEAIEFLKLNKPDENKINWNEANEVELSLVKHIASNMYIVRPHLPAELVLWYAKGDYLQYALFSLLAIYYNLKSDDIHKYVSLLLKAPVSIQKHGIRIAFNKYTTEEKIRVATEQWALSRNSSIRAVLFMATFDLLRKEKEEATIQAIWSVLGSFMDDLNDEDDKIIFYTLQKMFYVPVSVVGDFFKKAYFVLKRLSGNPELAGILAGNIRSTGEVIEYLEPEFVEKCLLNSIELSLQNYDDYDHRVKIQILASHLLLSKDLDCQVKKYNNLLQPIIEKCVPMWANGERHLLGAFLALIESICIRTHDFVFQMKMIVPAVIFNNLNDAIQKGSWRIQEDYVMLRRLELTARYLEAIAQLRKEDVDVTWDSIRTQAAQRIAIIAKEMITEDQRTFFPSIYMVFKDVIQTFFDSYIMCSYAELEVLYEMLEWEDFPEMYLLVLELLPNSAWGEKDDWLTKSKKKIYSHPWLEVSMRYFRKYKEHYDDVEEYSDEGTEGSEYSTDSNDSEQTDTDEEAKDHSNDNLTNKPDATGYRCIIM